MKKAQIRMSETIAVIFIFFVLILFGIIFYYKYSQVAMEEERQELLGKKAIDITLKTLFLPELLCSRGEAEPDLNCFDLLKLNHAPQVFSDHFRDYYFDLFPFTSIKIEQLYPHQQNWTLYHKPKIITLPDGSPAESQQKEATHFIIALRDQTIPEPQGHYSLGVLTVEVYS